jgi:hypothetical protein
MGIKITVNGQEYSSIDQMPDDVRREYQKSLELLADRNGNGVPDALEGRVAGASLGRGVITTIRHSSIHINGQSYGSMDEVPPEVRTAYQKALSKVDANGNGIPDAVEAMIASARPGTRLDSSDPTDSRLPGSSCGAGARGVIDADALLSGLTEFLSRVLFVAELAVLGGALWIMWILDDGSRSQGGRIYLAIGAMVVLVIINTQISRLRRRRTGGDPTGYLRSHIGSMLWLLLCAAGLLGAAFFMP